ncbi:hypothetical protein BDZ85DRAFT_7635 [Elsinoe ampelina]|uniref:F-box domain-containing protein n=1 Tax=Elsinoe ampelina TaxID=302913 RepID=A0A6A6GPV4_9PEZI|nr:hypothetical protein BDZ85DRAFT_7635 [Elsinoe ampelina]
MEAAPPSYETATLVNPWDLVAAWLPSNDLCSAALVCSKWHSIFTPHLWGNPAAHFGTENDRVYIALTKFQRTLPWVRKYVRAFTHTLQLPPASAEIYYGPHDGWLRDVLQRLENLQTLVVRGLPFFDHGALTALRPKPSQDPSSSSPQSFALRLLDASKCENATTSGLLAALKRLDQLLYLDLSYTYPAKDRQVLAQLSNFAGLQVLKLRGISLKDDDVQILAKAIATRVRSLDLRNNKLTDQSVTYLTSNCFTSHDANHTDDSQHRSDGERSSLLHYLGPDMLRIYQGDGFEGYLRRSLSARFVARLAFEDAPESGITHLYISENNLSVEGMSAVLRTKRLHVLDARADTRLPNKLLNTNGDYEIVHPGSEKLPLTLAKKYGHTLTYMKIDHEIITKKPPEFQPHSDAEDRSELADTAVEDDPPDLPPRHAELEASSNVPELPHDNNIHELAGSDPHVPLPLRNKKIDSKDASPAGQQANDQVKRGSIYAPEPASATVSSISQTSSAHPTHSSPTISTFGSNNPYLSAQPPDNSSQTTTLQVPRAGQTKPRSYSSLVSTRHARRLALDPATYHPSMTPHLRTLVLSTFPSHSPDNMVVSRLQTFITACASEALLATQLSEKDYSLPPSRSGPAHRREAARRLFALETIILEVVSSASDRKQSKGWKGKSTTEDRDSASLWRTAESDFSFFGDEGEMMFPSIEDRRDMWVEGKEVVGPGMQFTGQNGKAPVVNRAETWVDNITHLGKWRSAKKEEWERAVENARLLGQTESDVEVEGYWPGVIRVVRLTGQDDDGEGEEKDYYGNIYGSHGIYR